VEFFEAASSAGAGGAGTGYMRDPRKIHMGITQPGAYAGNPAERAAVTRGIRSPHRIQGSVKAEVDFGGMAAAAKKSGDELGKFKLLKISPAPQMAKDHEGLMTPGDLAHTPYVP
jgi:hypothetical protein